MEDFEDSGGESSRLEHELEQVEEGIKRWDQMRAVLEMYDMHHRESIECEECASDDLDPKEFSPAHRVVMECRLDSSGEESHSSDEGVSSEEGSSGDSSLWGSYERCSPIAIQTA
ncbi:unnamed protein product [Cylicostephanus goldi]|uniref:Uncharacterized protein n=1 Tax=Cylicostephanus goldi TaxID=71465 RepID=A0A3P7RBG2_CYLGO|nr:unnamed protein product [Cylicostephanus goldi]